MTELRKCQDGSVEREYEPGCWRTLITPTGDMFGRAPVELVEEAITLWRKPTLPDGWGIDKDTGDAIRQGGVKVDPDERLLYFTAWHREAEVREALQVLDILTKGTK